MKTFKSEDGSTRCTKCHLHPDMCFCDDPNSPVVTILEAAANRVATFYRERDAELEDRARYGPPHPDDYVEECFKAERQHSDRG